MAFVTSSGTMDKQNPAVRKYIAERAELLGAIRLPNNAFLANAGTGVVADILFLQKRDRPIEVDADWIHLGITEDGHTINQYFVDNPDMVLGELTEESTQYGKKEVTVKPYEDTPLSEFLSEAITNIHGHITEVEREEDAIEGDDTTVIPADPEVRNFSYTTVNGEIYFRTDSVMKKFDGALTAQNRIKGLIGIRDCVRRLIDLQMNYADDRMLEAEQKRLNDLYDAYTAKYGLINSRGNSNAFNNDSSYACAVLCTILAICRFVPLSCSIASWRYPVRRNVRILESCRRRFCAAAAFSLHSVKSTMKWRVRYYLPGGSVLSLPLTAD